MTLLHYSCKAGAHGVGKRIHRVAPPRGGGGVSNASSRPSGDPAAALRLSSQLLSLGADVSLRSRWTNMNALHYAAYFDVPELIRVLLKGSKPRGGGPESPEGSAGEGPEPPAFHTHI